MTRTGFGRRSRPFICARISLSLSLPAHSPTPSLSAKLHASLLGSNRSMCVRGGLSVDHAPIPPFDMEGVRVLEVLVRRQQYLILWNPQQSALYLPSGLILSCVVALRYPHISPYSTLYCFCIVIVRLRRVVGSGEFCASCR